MACIDTYHLTCAYHGQRALHNVSCTLHHGAMTGLVGPNGSGKSTLLKVLAGIHAPKSGHIHFRGDPISALPPKIRAQHIAYVPQHTPTSLPLRVWDFVMLGRYPYQRRLAWENMEDRHAVAHALASMACQDLHDRLMLSLSGGERQRVIVARALAQQPELLLLDEPTTHIDPTHQMVLLEHLSQLQQQGLTICIAVHDMNIAAQFCDRLLVLDQGTLIDAGSCEAVIHAGSLSKAFQIPIGWQRGLMPIRS